MGRALTSEEIASYHRDGVVLVPEAVEQEWVVRLNGLIETILESPGRWASDSGASSGTAGRALDERYLWKDNELVERFVFESGVAALVGQAMGARELRFYFDHWFVKEPGEGTETPWHQDVSYWPFEGKQIASLWLSLTEVDERSSPLEFVKGSHRWGKRFKPERFVKTDEKLDWIELGERSKGEAVPDIDGRRREHQIFRAPLRPGDGLIFSAWILHAAPSNRSRRRRAASSTRWLGDDVRWNPHPAADPTVRAEDLRLGPGEPVTDDDVFPVAWRAP